MQRRTILKAVTLPIILPQVGIIGKALARSAVGWASSFGGLDRLQMNGYGPQWPSSAQQMLFAFITKGAAPTVRTGANTEPTIFVQDTSSGSSNFWIYTIVNATQSQVQFVFNFGSGPNATGSLYGTAASQSLAAYTGALNRTLLYVDLSVPEVVVTVNRNQIATNFDTVGWNSGVAIQFGSWGGAPLRLSAGGWPYNQTAGGFKGTAAEWTIFVGEQINILDPSVQNGFQNSDGTMTSWSSRNATGMDLIPGLRPAVYLSGGPQAFKHSATLSTAGETATAAITELAYDDDDYFSQVAGPGITWAPLDPWNNVGM